MPRFKPLWFAALVLTASLYSSGAVATPAAAGEPRPWASSLPSLFEPPAQTEALLARLTPDRPRLLVRPADFARLPQRFKQSPQLAAWLEKLRRTGAAILGEPVSTYNPQGPNGLLATSRQVLRRTSTLALLHRLDPGGPHLARLWQELAAAAAFPDWNPGHFLDVAEMTHAFALAYDWLYDSWSPEQRQVIRTAIITHALEPALRAYRDNPAWAWWVTSADNWNIVCNSGIGLGALAILEEAPEVALAALNHALASIRGGLAAFAPDGGWPEGTLYWGYGTYYTVLIMAALESSLGTDLGLSTSPGFARTGFFPLYLTGPSGQTFNFANADGEVYWTTQMFWLARRFAQPVFAWYARQTTQVRALDILWYDPGGEPPGKSALPLDALFQGTGTVTCRSAWDDPRAFFVGFQAGNSKTPHSHLDLGGFVVEALGVHWAVDLGGDDYGLPGYFDTGRWDYYRRRAEGHNTLVLDPGSGPDQLPGAAASIVAFQSVPQGARVVADLTPAYASHATRVWRGLACLERRRLLIQDEIQASRPLEVVWGLHTPATVAISPDKRTALLHQGSATLEARILAPEQAGFRFLPACPGPLSPHPRCQAGNDGIRKLTIQLPDTKEVRLAVLLTPLGSDPPPPDATPLLTPLATWPGRITNHLNP